MDDFVLNESNHSFLIDQLIRNKFNLFNEVIYDYKDIVMSFL
jgi:hypothetical protein